ncbi:MAG TPA: hypothetical protein VGP33_11945 [Chloroflexota bacterium]|jgi:hypothetical protein|nr:hypothetical protein [Chloroflexota bacterium]
MKRVSLSLTFALVLILALVSTAAAQSGPVTVTLATQNSSGVSGTATLTAMGNQTQVVVKVTGEPAGGSEPEHIHVGSCPAVGAVKYPLANVVNGTATTVVNVPLSTLTAGGYAINLHESAAKVNIYIACGDIMAAAGASTTAATAAAPAAATTTTPTAAPSTGGGGLATGQAALPLALILGAGLVLSGLVGRRART